MAGCIIASELLRLNNYLHANPQNPPVPSIVVPDTRGISSPRPANKPSSSQSSPRQQNVPSKPFLLTADKDRRGQTGAKKKAGQKGTRPVAMQIQPKNLHGARGPQQGKSHPARGMGYVGRSETKTKSRDASRPASSGPPLDLAARQRRPTGLGDTEKTISVHPSWRLGPLPVVLLKHTRVR